MFDPHGDPIPNAQGKISDDRQLVPLYSYDFEKPCRGGGVRNGSDDVLAALSAKGIELGTILHKKEVLQLPIFLVEEVLVHAVEDKKHLEHD